MPHAKTKIYQTYSSEQTKQLGRELGEAFIKKKAIRGKRNGALILGLQGNLGAGKTTFTQGFFKGLGLKRNASSPTFIIVRRHALPGKIFKNVFHIDAYRLKTAEQLEVLGMKEIFSNPQNIVLIEWAERVKKLLPKDTLWLAFTHGRKENERKLIIKQ